MEPLILTGFIFQDEDGYFNSECHQLEIATCGRSVAEVERRTADMIQAYFQACETKGLLKDVLARLRAPIVDFAHLTYKTDFRVRSSHP